MNPAPVASRLRLPSPAGPARGQRGFSLPEIMVASAIFLLVMLAAYQAFQRSQESYRLGQNQAEMVQAARVAFDQMAADVRLAGFEFDVDGEKEPYPNQSDEPLEFMHRRAIVVRANFDFDKDLKGRHPGLQIEDPASNSTTCCPVVTTANSEIVGFALGKPSGTQPPGTITFKADVNGTLNALDTEIRDGIIDGDGDIVGEETVTKSGFELRDPSDGAYSPPYTLYRFRVKDPFSANDPISLEPLIDNVYSLEFTYFDQAGNLIIGPGTPGTQADWGDDNGKASEAGRATRWNVRQVKVSVVTLTPDTDLRLKARGAATGVDNFQGRRKYTLGADLIPPNLGRRGSRDRDINPPEPPRNVQVCSGQCGMVRVSWDPGPPEDKVADYIVALCEGPCEDDQSNLIGAFIVLANFDATTNREYATFTSEDAPVLGRTGGAGPPEVYARVIARNVSGTESECPVAGCPTCCESQSGAVVAEQTRPDTFPSGFGSGYDPTNASFPDAKPDNASGQPIVTDATSPYFPASLATVLTLDAPMWTLNKSGAAGSAPNDWTTKDLGGGVTAAMSCFQQESTPADGSDDPAYRTPYVSWRRDSELGNTYVWRVAGYENNVNNRWGGATAPRNFVPTESNLYDFVHLDLEGGALAYPDDSSYEFSDTTDGPRYNGYRTNFTRPGGVGSPLPLAQPIRAVTPCEVYYYRFRPTSLCWEDKEQVDDNGTPANSLDDFLVPPDAYNDNNANLGAWMVAADRPGTYRAEIKSLGPFYPPMLNSGDTDGERDRPDQGVHDSDAHSGGASSDTYALAAYALPQRVVDDATGTITGWVKPAAPTEFYMTRVGYTGTSPLSAGGAPSQPDARLIFNAARRTAPAVGEGSPQPAAFRSYRVYRKTASAAPAPASDFDPGYFTGSQLLTFNGQQASFESLAPNDIRAYTLAGSSLLPGPDDADPSNPSAPSVDWLNDLAHDWADGSDADCSQDPDDRPLNTQCTPWIYYLKTTQCTRFDDGIDTAAAEESDPSNAFAFPCDLHYDVRSISVSPGSANTPPATVQFTPEIRDAGGSFACSGRIASARLLAFRQRATSVTPTPSNPDPLFDNDGDFIGSSDWRGYEDASGQCDAMTFPNPSVGEALRGYSGAVRFVVEISSDANGTSGGGNGNDPDVDPSRGCRLRSDFGPLPPAGTGAIVALDASACGDVSTCGSNAQDADGNDSMPDTDPGTIPPGHIFGYFDQDQVELSNNDRTMTIRVPKMDTCGQSFSLLGLELKLAKNSASGDNALPALVSAQITGGVSGGSFTLPDVTRNSAADLWVAGDADDAEDDAGERDLDGTDGTMTLRWRDSFCSLTPDPGDGLAKTCTYPLVQGSASELTIALEFNGPLCDVTVAQFNFRVPLSVAADGTLEDELICTQRTARPNDTPHGGAADEVDRFLCPTVGGDPDGHSLPAGIDPDQPAGCRLEGTGRGGYTTAEVACLECTETCAPCQCPINDNDADIAQDLDPTWFLEDDIYNDFGARASLLRLQFTQQTGTPCDSPECAFQISSLTIRYECTGDRDCGTEQFPGTEVPGKLTDHDEPGVPDAKLVHGDLTEVALPNPSDRQQGDPQYRQYTWTGLAIDIVDGETFELVFRFDDSIDRMNLVDVDIRIARPMPFECQANGAPGGAQAPLCSMPSAAIYLQQ